MSSVKQNNPETMCYITAHQKHKEKNNNYKLVDEMKHPSDLCSFDFSNGFYTIELEIWDKSYKGKKKGFFLPRLFCHTFNMDIRKSTKDMEMGNFVTKAYIYQSWFKKFPYELHKVYNRNGFVTSLIKRIESFKNNPLALFRLFGYKWDDLDIVVDYIRKNYDTIDLMYRIEIHH